MHKRRELAILCSAVLFGLGVVVPALGQSYDYPDATTCAAVGVNVGSTGTEDIFLITASTPPVKALGCNFTACDKGDVVARKAMKCLCDEADAGAYTCSTGSAGLGCTVDLDPGTTATETVTCTTAAGKGFLLAGASTLRKIQVAPLGVVMKSLDLQDGTVVHNHEMDLLPQVLIRVDPNGNNAVVNFEVCGPGDLGDQGCQSPHPFSVDPSAHATDEALHNAIAVEIELLPLQLQAIVHCPGPGLDPASRHASAPELFSAGCFVQVPNANSKSSAWQIKGSAGQINSLETSVPGGGIPTLSPWGVALLAIMLLTALYLLRRRQRAQQS